MNPQLSATIRNPAHPNPQLARPISGTRHITAAPAFGTPATPARLSNCDTPAHLSENADHFSRVGLDIMADGVADAYRQPKRASDGSNSASDLAGAHAFECFRSALDWRNPAAKMDEGACRTALHLREGNSAHVRSSSREIGFRERCFIRRI